MKLEALLIIFLWRSYDCDWWDWAHWVYCATSWTTSWAVKSAPIKPIAFCWHFVAIPTARSKTTRWKTYRIIASPWCLIGWVCWFRLSRFLYPQCRSWTPANRGQTEVEVLCFLLVISLSFLSMDVLISPLYRTCNPVFSYNSSKANLLASLLIPHSNQHEVESEVLNSKCPHKFINDWVNNMAALQQQAHTTRLQDNNSQAFLYVQFWG